MESNPELRCIIKDIGVRLMSEVMLRSPIARAEQRTFWLAISQNRNDEDAFVKLIRDFTSRSPDIWIRFCDITPVPDRLVRQIKPTSNLGVSPGTFPMPEHLIHLHLMPSLSYPSLARLAKTCKYWHAFIDTHDLVDAIGRYKARTHCRFKMIGHSSIFLWTIDEEPVILHAIDSNMSIPGMEFAGHTYVGTPRLDTVARVEFRWPIVMEPEPGMWTHHGTQFVSVFTELLKAKQGVTVWSKIEPSQNKTQLLHLYIHGDAKLIRKSKDSVLRYTIEFQPSTWGPRK